jgi:hypothetical protein
MPTRRALWRPQGQPVMMPTPGPPDKRDGLGAVNAHTGAPLVLFRRRQRRRDIAARWQAVGGRPPRGPSYIAWANAAPHGDDAGEAIGRAAAGRVVWRYVPTDSPWLNPLARLWRQCRREVPPGALLAALDALLKAAHAGFDRANQRTERVFSISGAQAA